VTVNMIGIWSSLGTTSQIVVQGSSTQMSGPFVTANTWTHISWTCSSTIGYRLYVNGTFSGSTGVALFNTSYVITWLQIGTNFVCAASPLPSTAYQGSIDELYVHNRQLTQADVTGLANLSTTARLIMNESDSSALKFFRTVIFKDFSSRIS
jgi:hypothetical protein